MRAQRSRKTINWLGERERIILTLHYLREALDR